MVNYRDMLRLSEDPNISKREMERVLHCSHHTIDEALAAAKAKGIRWPLDESVTNAMLKDLLFPDRGVSGIVYEEPDYQYIHAELARPGVNLTILHQEYCEKCYADNRTPYMYTQFCEKYRRWARITKATMRIHHKPGDAMEVDWAGNTLPIFDPVTGDMAEAYLFVAVLPCSCFAYAELCGDMKQENWLLCHVHAYAYFDGVTRLLIPDNLKTGVTKNTRYETVLNRSYQELAEHYGTAIVPARVEHPKDKSHAEGTVRYASTWILAALRDERFFSLSEAQTAVRDKLEALNDKHFKKREGTRRSAYLEEESAFMNPLPPTPYEPATWTGEMKVGADYLISDGKNRYSVPFDLIGEKVVAKLTKNTVEIFHNGDRVAVHMRAPNTQREPIVRMEHMPPEHQKYTKYNADDFTVWAKSVGEAAATVVRRFLAAGKEPEVGFKSCASMTRLAERYGSERLENACKRLLAYTQTPSIRTLTNILKNGQDHLSLPTDQPEAKPEESHGFTRGADYYRRNKGGDSK